MSPITPHVRTYIVHTTYNIAQLPAGSLIVIDEKKKKSKENIESLVV